MSIESDSIDEIQNVTIENNSVQISWNQLEKGRFFAISTPVLTLARGLFYPLGLIKTRLMIQQHDIYKNTFRAMVQISKEEGIRGLYAGFSTSLIGVLPGQVIYVYSYERVRQSLDQVFRNDSMRSFVAGFVASCFSSVVSVPVDVINQRQMIQTKSLSNRKYRHGLHGFSTILKEEGIRGLYRGMGSSILVYAPTSALFWGFYNIYKSSLISHEHDAAMIATTFPLYYMGITALSALLTSCTVGLLTNPLDVVKTTLQTQEGEKVPRNMYQMGLELYKRDGIIKFWSRGLVARIMAICFNSTATLLLYEAMKVYALKDEYKMKPKDCF